jgi:hypothetical protein
LDVQALHVTAQVQDFPLQDVLKALALYGKMLETCREILTVVYVHKAVQQVSLAASTVAVHTAALLVSVIVLH